MSGPVIVRPRAFRSPERKARLLLASLPIFAGLLSKDGTVLECNFAPLGGPLDTRPDWIGRPFERGPWWDYSEESRADILIMLGRAQRGERVARERLYRRPDGQMGVMMLTLVPLFAPYGQPDAILVMAVDVTERRRERDTAERIAFDMAHRLRNSFTIMRTLATRSDLEDTDGRTALSRRLSRVRDSHSVAFRYLFFDVPIQNVVEAAIDDQDRLSRYEFDPVSVPADYVEMLMLALGELARKGEAAELFCLRRGDRRLRLQWRESTPRADADLPAGLSHVLVKTMPEQQSGGQVQIRNDLNGFFWLFDCPLIHPDLDETPTGDNTAAP